MQKCRHRSENSYKPRIINLILRDDDKGKNVDIWSRLCSKIFVLRKRNAEGIRLLPKAKGKTIILLKDNCAYQQLD